MSGNFVDSSTSARRPGWHKVEDPGTGWLASKTATWTADRFTTASGGMAVDFSSVVPGGTKAVLVSIDCATAMGFVYARQWGDTEISNTPNASSEFSAFAFSAPAVTYVARVPMFLSTDYKAEIAVTSVSQDIYVSYPVAYMI